MAALAAAAVTVCTAARRLARGDRDDLLVDVAKAELLGHPLADVLPAGRNRARDANDSDVHPSSPSPGCPARRALGNPTLGAGALSSDPARADEPRRPSG